MDDAREWPFTVFFRQDFDRALVRGSEEGTTVVVTGSFHTVGDAMARLEVSPTEG